jgi:hypothetical protein
LIVQITKKENWEGLKNKLSIEWGAGQICIEENGKIKPVAGTDTFDEIDTVGKKYLYAP